MRPLVLLVFAPLASCATPENRVRSALIDAGLSPRMSECMAGRMVDRLSTGQLRQLGQLRGVVRGRGVDDFVRALRGLDDPQAVSVTTRAALHCALRL